jgi:hypothetical protein
MVSEEIAAKVMQHTEGATRQIQNIRKIFMDHLASKHVQTELLNLVHQTQRDLAAGGKTRNSVNRRAAPPPQLAKQSKLRVKLAARAAETGASATPASSTAAWSGWQCGFVTCNTREQCSSG